MVTGKNYSVIYTAGASSLIGSTHGCAASSREKGEDGFQKP